MPARLARPVDPLHRAPRAGAPHTERRDMIGARGAAAPGGLRGLQQAFAQCPAEALLMLRLVHWVRSFGAVSATDSWKIGDLSNAGSQLGQSPLRSPSVFNFFRPGYVPPSTALSAGVVAPEFQIVTESSVGGYLNFMMGVISNGLVSGDITTAYAAELALVTDAAALVRRLNLLLCGGQLSVANQGLIVNALNATPITASSSSTLKRNRVCAAVLMVMASSEYLIQK